MSTVECIHAVTHATLRLRGKRRHQPLGHTGTRVWGWPRTTGRVRRVPG
jgi:hypothetical protein